MSKIDTGYINRNIRRLRERDFITQEDMAGRLGISQNTYSKIEIGKTKLTLDKLFAIAHILGIDVAELLDTDVVK